MSVQRLLQQPLGLPRVPALEAACIAVATARPLWQTLTDLRQVLAGSLPADAGWRLQVLVSALYHHAGASLELTESLRAQVQAAQATAEKSDPHVL